jgi:hypothetical protein
MKVQWDMGPRPYAQGVKMGVLYPDDSPGVAWNGLISVNEEGSPAQEARYFDGVRYDSKNPSLPFAGTLAAYTYPDELEPYIGTKDFFTAQPNRLFGFSYRTNTEIHLVYGTLLAPSPRPYTSISQQSDPVSFQWAFTTLPRKIPGGKPSSHIVILVEDVPPDVMVQLEAALYGDDENDPWLPDVDEIQGMYDFIATLLITDNGDGTWTAEGPDELVTLLPGGKFQITADTLTYVDLHTYFVSTY